MPECLNEDVAGRLEEVARLLAAQGANRFRVRAYERAANTVRRLPRPVSELLERQGVEGLQALPGATPRSSSPPFQASAGRSPTGSIMTWASRHSKTWKPPRTTGGSTSALASGRNAWPAFAIRSRTAFSVSGHRRRSATALRRLKSFSTSIANIGKKPQLESS
jgi:hypothetical protein